MAHEMFKVSSQYLKKDPITVTILDVINPVHYVIKETPDINASSEAKNFLEAEESMQKYYNSFDTGFFKLPLKDSIIVVFHEKKFYRARVNKILNLSAGHLFKVYLVDYGVECSITRDCIYEIEHDFLSHPFQAVSMKLLGIEPISLVMNSTDLSMSYGPVTYWDPSAEIYIHDMQKTMCNAYIEIKAVDEQCVYGCLFMCFEDNSVKCINDELISNTFARFDENCWNKVYKIEDVLENNFSKYETKDSTPEPKKPDPGSTSGLSPSENLGGFMDLRSSFISPSDGKIVATSTISMKDIESSQTDSEDVIVKVQEKSEAVSTVAPADKSPDHKEKCEAVSSDVPVEKSPDPKAITLSRFQKLQMLNRKRHSSDIGSDKTESSGHVAATEEIKSCGKSPPSVCSSNTLNDHSHQSYTQKSPSSYVYEKETKEGNDALSRTPKLKKLQELRRKQQNSPVTNVHSAGASDEHKLPSIASPKKAENVNVVEDNAKVEDTGAAALTSPKQECGSEVQTHASNKLKKLKELNRKRLSNSAPSTDSSKNSIKSLNLCDTTSEKDISTASDANKDSLIELNNSKTSEQRKSSDSENLKSSPVLPSVSKDMNCAPESTTTSKLKKLQELRKKRQSNIVSCDNQLTGAKVSSDLEDDLMNIPKDGCSVRKVENCDTENLKSSPVQPSVSKDMSCSPESGTTSKLKKLQELRKTRLSNIVSCDNRLTDAKVSSDLEDGLMNSPKYKKEDCSVRKGESCDSVNLKSSPVQLSVSEDIIRSPESAATSKLKKLQELRKKRPSNIVSSGDQLTDVRGSSDLENDFISVPKEKKEDRSVSLNVIVDEGSFSNFNTANVSNVCSDSANFKSSCDSPQASEMCHASSPSSLENSPRQGSKPKAQTYASKRFQKLQELNKKRQSLAFQRNIHSGNGRDKFNEENSTPATSEKVATLSPDLSLNRSNECIDNIHLPTVLSDSGTETCIPQDSENVCANSIFRDNENTKDTIPNKANDNACFSPVTPSDSKDIYCDAASEDNSKQESIPEAQLAASRRFQKLQLLRRRKLSSSSPNDCQGTDNISTSSEKNENATEFFSSVDKTPDELNARESEETKKASVIEGNSFTQDGTDSDYQVSDAERIDPTSEISLRPENKPVIISENARTLQRLQQKVRKKNMNLQSDPSSEQLLDNMNNNENLIQAKTPDMISQNQNSLSNVQNSEEITLSEPSALSKESLNQESSCLSEDEGIVCKRKELLNRNSPEIPQTSNLAYESDHTTPGAGTVSEPVSPNYTNENQKSPSSDACSSSYVAQNKQALSSAKNTRAETQNSPSNDSRSNLDSEDSSPMKPKQSQILQEMLDLSDSDDILYSISTKARESTCDNIDV